MISTRQKSGKCRAHELFHLNGTDPPDVIMPFKMESFEPHHPMILTNAMPNRYKGFELQLLFSMKLCADRWLANEIHWNLLCGPCGVCSAKIRPD